jgi:hypothetical protein
MLYETLVWELYRPERLSGGGESREGLKGIG